MSVTHAYKTDQSFQILFISMIVLGFINLFSAQAMAESKPESMQGQVMKQEVRILDPCPNSPNCVNSQTTKDDKHFIKALKVKDGDLLKNRNKLLEVLNTIPRVKVVIIEDNYLKAEFTSKFLSFVDDVEFVIDEKHIDIRSASRKGYYDLGANRKRIEKIRKELKN